MSSPPLHMCSIFLPLFSSLFFLFFCFFAFFFFFCAEWEEWGNPNQSKFFETMLSYSPYDNVERKDYPSLLVTAGLNDPRVQYWEPAKWVAKLREMRTNPDRPLYLKTDMSSGHFSASDRYKFLKETAFEYAFIVNELSGEK